METVVWNGSMERDAIEAERRIATAAAHDKVRHAAARVESFLMDHGPATAPQITQAVSISRDSLNSAISNLVRSGRVIVESVPSATGLGRRARRYRLGGGGL